MSIVSVKPSLCTFYERQLQKSPCFEVEIGDYFSRVYINDKKLMHIEGRIKPSLELLRFIKAQNPKFIRVGSMFSDVLVGILSKNTNFTLTDTILYKLKATVMRKKVWRQGLELSENWITSTDDKFDRAMVSRAEKEFLKYFNPFSGGESFLQLSDAGKCVAQGFVDMRVCTLIPDEYFSACGSENFSQTAILNSEKPTSSMMSVQKKELKEAMICGIFVDRPFRGRGYGLEVTKSLARKLKKEGFEVFLSVDATNKPAINLYEKLGFEEVERYTVISII